MTIKDFYEKAAADDSMKKKIAEMTKAGKSLEDFISEFGIEGTVDELKSYAETLSQEGKLDKSQLDAVAGGTTPVTTVTTVGVAVGTYSLAAC